MKINRQLIHHCLLGALLLSAVNSRAQSVTAGSFHSLFLTRDGNLWATGKYGQAYVNAYDPTNQQIVASNVVAVSERDAHGLFLKDDGSLWGVGDNFSGQLGDGTRTIQPPFGKILPEQILDGDVIAIAAGGMHSLFLKKDGSLWAMGNNSFGQLGDNSYKSTNRPKQIIANDVIAIAAGERHSLFIKRNGSLWAMGDNSFCQLGDGTANWKINRPERIVESGVTAIAAGFNHSLFLKSDGSLWATGYNGYGQLGDGTRNIKASRPVQVVAGNVLAIAAGRDHSLFLKRDGSLWAMGRNFAGELGDGTYNSTNRPEQIVAIGVTAIAAGAGFSLFFKDDGSLWFMGYTGFGNDGNGNYNSIKSPKEIIAGYGVYNPPPLKNDLTTNSNNLTTTHNQPDQLVVNPDFNHISGHLLSGHAMRLSFVGIPGVNYALDRTFNLAPPDWIPQATNTANSFGAVVFTNAPDTTTNNFWRIRSVP